jgi:hypothetical protein
VYNQGVPLSLLMKLVALIALDLAFLRVQPFLPQAPLQLFALVMLDVVIIQYFILGRRLGAFHFTFLIVGLVASMALHTLCYDGLYHRITRPPTWRPQSLGYFVIVDRCVTSALGLLLAWAAGLWAAHLVRTREPRPGRLCRRSKSFFQGALIGLGVFMVIVIMLNYSGQVPALLSPGEYFWLLGLGLAICPLLGGTTVLLLERQWPRPDE